MSLNPDDAAIAATIISMAKSLNLSVIAKGSEENITKFVPENLLPAWGFRASPLSEG